MGDVSCPPLLDVVVGTADGQTSGCRVRGRRPLRDGPLLGRFEAESAGCRREGPERVRGADPEGQETARLSHDPSVNKALKADGMSAACDKMKMNALSKILFLAMGENGRYGIIPQVCNSFKTIMAAQRGEVICEVTSAKPLDAAMSKEVEAAIGGLLKSGEKSKISYKVDPSIIGGLVVSVCDKYVDMSIGSKLKKYEAMIKSAA